MDILHSSIRRFAIAAGLPFLRLMMDWCVIKKKKNGISLKIRKNKMFQVLTYHRVGSQVDGIFDPIPVDVFEQQICCLAAHYNVLNASDAWAMTQKGCLPDKAIVITLDDGYRDNYDFAFPVLKKYDLPATLFLTTGPLEGMGPLWHDQVFTAFARTRKRAYILNGTSNSLATLKDRQTAAMEFSSYARTLDENKLKASVSLLMKDLNVTIEQVVSRCPMLDWQQVREMSESGIEIGAHTVTHPIMSRLPYERQMEEIAQSIEGIFRNVGKRTTVFSYPNGRDQDFNEATLEILKTLGIKASFTTNFGGNSFDCDPYFLKRGAAWSEDIEVFSLQLIWNRIVNQ